MTWALLIFAALVFLFGFVLAFGAPYLPTLSPQIKTAFEMLELKPGQTVLELGCGDGRVLVEAARRGLKATGYELNPILVLCARIYTWRYRHQVKIIWGNYWAMEWPETDGIFVFLLDKYMKKLDKKIMQTYEGRKIKLVSFAFQVPGRRAVSERSGLFLYNY